jgi:hypothetical protein
LVNSQRVKFLDARTYSLMSLSRTKLAYLITSIFPAIFFCACIDSEELSAQFINAGTTNEALAYAKKAQGLNYDGIPIFLSVLKDGLGKEYSVLSYGKTNISLKSLHTMAVNGIFISDEVPVLLEVIKRQPSVEDTLVTEDILKIVTGIDVGYNGDFIKNYSAADEPKRQEMLKLWEDWATKSNRRSQA